MENAVEVYSDQGDLSPTQWSLKTSAGARSLDAESLLCLLSGFCQLPQSFVSFINA